jgi:hypothetical protein
MKVESGATTASLEVGMDNAAQIVAISFRLALPEGVTAKAARYITINEERINMDWVREFTEDPEAGPLDGAYDLKIQNASDGNKMYSLYPNEAVAYLGNTGTLLTIPLTLANVADGTYEVKLYAISMGDADGVSVADAEEVTCSLQVGEGTGINDIKALDSKAPIYNVAGQRVSKAQKGVYIQNGKKVAVK